MNANQILSKLLEDIATHGLSVARVCHVAGIDPSLVSRWKAGRVEPRLSSLEKLRAAFETIREGFR